MAIQKKGRKTNSGRAVSAAARGKKTKTASQVKGKIEAKAKEIKTIKCFISMPFDPKYDIIYNNGIFKCRDQIPGIVVDLKKLNMEPSERSTVDANVTHAIDQSDLMIALVTYDSDRKTFNPNVMFEIGYADATKMPVVLVCSESTISKLPVNIKNRIAVMYKDNPTSNDLQQLSNDLAAQIRTTFENPVSIPVRGHYRVECFTQRESIKIPELIERANKRVEIITTNLDYIDIHCKIAIAKALERNRKASNPGFKVEILTMDPEADTTKARAAQLGRKTQHYRDELRSSLESLKKFFNGKKEVEIVTYSSLPTQITFIIDEFVITSVISFGQQSRENIHFVLKGDQGKVSESFLAHFRAMKALAVSGSHLGD